MTRDVMTRPPTFAEAYCAALTGFIITNSAEKFADAGWAAAQSDALREAWLAEHDDHPDKQKADALEKQRHETALILQDVRRVLGIDLTPLPRFDYFTWTQVVAQTILGEVERLAECEADLATARGLLKRWDDEWSEPSSILTDTEAFLSPAQPEPPASQEPARCRKCGTHVVIEPSRVHGWTACCAGSATKCDTWFSTGRTPDAALAAWQKVNGGHHG